MATAHVGPMYAGLMALELLGIPSRWLATAPIAQSSYAAALISTADQTETQVAKACMRALASGHVLCLAVDGAANPAAPRVLRGQEVTYSGFAAHLAHRQGVPSVFYAPAGKRQVAYTLAMLPAATPGETPTPMPCAGGRPISSICARMWPVRRRTCLSGGIWRHVRATDRSAPP